MSNVRVIIIAANLFISLDTIDAIFTARTSSCSCSSDCSTWKPNLRSNLLLWKLHNQCQLSIAYNRLYACSRCNRMNGKVIQAEGKALFLFPKYVTSIELIYNGKSWLIDINGLFNVIFIIKNIKRVCHSL